MIYIQLVTTFCLIAIVFGLIRAISTLKELRGFYKDSIQMEEQILNMVNRIEKRVSNLENRNRGL